MKKKLWELFQRCRPILIPRDRGEPVDRRNQTHRDFHMNLNTLRYVISCLDYL